MNRLEKLIIKAKRLARPGVELPVAIIERSGGSWTAVAHLCDGVSGHAPTIHRAVYATMETAVEHIRALALEYPNSKDVPVIIDDLG